MAKLALNVGCGSVHKQDDDFYEWVNIDMVDPADVICDVREGLPYKEKEVDLVFMDNLLEHFDNDEFLFVMNEVWRVLKTKGHFRIIVPDALNWFEGAAADPTHRRFFFWPRSFNYVDGSTGTWRRYGRAYGFKPWEIIGGGTDGKFIDVTLKPKR